MKSNTYDLKGWFVRLMMVVGLVVATSGMAAAWNITATSISVPSGKHGRMYFSFVDQYNNTVAGGSLPDGATSGTTRGVPSGFYTLSAFMDTTGTGFQHANDPAFSTSFPVSSDSGGPAEFTTPAPVFTAAPVYSPDPNLSNFNVNPIDSGAFVSFRPDKSNNLLTADRHTIYWSTGSDPANDQTGGGSLVITSRDPKVVIYNLANGTPYWFAVRAENSVNTALSAVVGPIVPAAQPASDSTINVPVDTTGITKNNPQPTPLIVVVTDNNNSFYFNYVMTPSDVQTVPVTGVKAGTYLMYTILDLSGTGNLDDPRNVTNMNGADRNQRPLPVTADGVSAITAPTTKLAVKNAGVAVSTKHSLQNGVENFSLWFNVAPMSKQLVNVTLESGPQISGPIDMGMSSNNDGNGSYGLSVQVPNRPAIGADGTYHFSLYYADAPLVAEPRTAVVTAVLDNFPNNTFPVGATGPGSVSPTFSWVNPGNLPGFVVTSLNFNSNGIDFLPMNVLSAKPDGASFPVGQMNNWDRSIQDLDGNQAQQSMTFTPNSSGPVIDDFSPKSGPGGTTGTSVTITGSGFDPTPANNTVKFNGMNVATSDITVNSTSSLTVKAPASSGVITVAVGGATAGSSAAFNATTTFSGAAQDNTGANLSGVGIALAENRTVSIGSSDPTATGNPNFIDIQVPARPYFALVFSKSSYYPTYTALMSINAPNSGNWSVFTSGDLSGRAVLPAAGKGVIIGKVQDWTVTGSSPPLAGAVVTAASLIHPDAPYNVKYTNGSSTVALDSAVSTGADGRFYVINVDEGDYVTVTASKASMGFQNRVFVTHGDAVSSHSIRGATSSGIPIATPAGGAYATAQNVTLSGGGTYDDIIYTTDGSDPTIFGKTYSSPIAISADTTLKFATKNKNVGQAFGPVQTQVYSIGASISGQVTDANSASPMQFVNVWLYDQNGGELKSTNTDSSGNYRFSGLGANTYKVCFYTGQGYINQCWQNTAGSPASATQIVLGTSPITGISAALQIGATITGRVTSNGTNGIQNVWVSVNDINGNGISGLGSAITDQNGDYTLNGLSSGTYKLYFNGQNSAYISQWYNNKVDAASADPVSVTVGNTYPGYNAQLAQEGTISGRVTNNSAAAIPGVNVQLRDTNGNSVNGVNGATTQPDGTYVLSGIPAGSYKLYFDGNTTGYIGQWYNNKANSASADTITIAAGETKSGINATLSSGATISGTVTNGSTGIQNVNVQLRDTSGNMIPNMFSVTTNQNGTYTLGGIPSGSYKLYFDGSSAGYISQWFNNKPDAGTADTFSVLVGDNLQNRNAVLLQGATISGTVTNGASGIQNVSAQLYDSTGNMMLTNTNTDPSGAYQFKGLQSGTYKVCFSPGGTNYVPKCYNNLPYIPQNATNIAVTAPTVSRNDINATMTLGGGISGQVSTGSSGIQNVFVEIHDTSTGNQLPGINSMWTDNNGNYTVQGIPAGGVKVYFNANNTIYGGQWYNGKSSFATSDTVTINAGTITPLSTAILSVATAPGAPAITGITPGFGQAQVYFNVPASDGGRQIRDYTVTFNPGGFTGFGINSPINVPSLTNGQNYTVSVTARNDIGNSTAASTPYSQPFYVNSGNDLQAAVALVANDGRIWTQSDPSLSFPPLMITKGVTITGGYNFDYSSTSGFTIIPGRVNIQGTGFKVIFKNVKVKAP